MEADFLALGVIWYFAFLFSVTVHEAAHAWIGDILGDSTAADNGQSSLDPIPHIKQAPMGMVVVPLISYFVSKGGMIGWGNAPYEKDWSLQYPRRSAIVSLAGPVANLLIALSAVTLIQLGLAFDVFYAPQRLNSTQLVSSSVTFLSPLAGVLSILFNLNLLLFVFNLIPLPPLDGFGVITLFLSKSTARKMMEFRTEGAFLIVGFLVAPKIIGYMMPVILDVTIKLIYPWTRYSFD